MFVWVVLNLPFSIVRCEESKEVQLKSLKEIRSAKLKVCRVQVCSSVHTFIVGHEFFHSFFFIGCDGIINRWRMKRCKNHALEFL